MRCVELEVRNLKLVQIIPLKEDTECVYASMSGETVGPYLKGG